MKSGMESNSNKAAALGRKPALGVALGRRSALSALATLLVLSGAAVRADDNTAAAAAVEAPSSQAPVRTHAHARHRTRQQGIDDEVRRLTSALDLDAGQQAKAHALLEDQYRQIRKVWADNPQPESDRVSPTVAILNRTRDRIREILNDEQRKKYPAAAPRELIGPAHTDLNHWLDLTQPKTSSPRDAAANPSAAPSTAAP
jgi:hypothetical protein